MVVARYEYMQESTVYLAWDYVISVNEQMKMVVITRAEKTSALQHEQVFRAIVETVRFD
jgi:hypothetical protein